jgi:hypothetical protein
MPDLGPNVAPALFLQLHQPNDPGRNEGCIREKRDRVALAFLHTFLAWLPTKARPSPNQLGSAWAFGTTTLRHWHRDDFRRSKNLFGLMFTLRMARP